MELPFLKNKRNQGGGTTQETESTSNQTLLESIGAEFMDAILRKDIKALKESLTIICNMIKEQDQD